MTGYSTRSLRTFYRQGLLNGSMEAGKYSFSEKDMEHFMAQPFITSGMESKRKMRVHHFLEEEHTNLPATCLIHDEPGRERMEQLNDILLEYINQECTGGFSYTCFFDDKKNVTRFIFIGRAKDATAILARIGKSE